MKSKIAIFLSAATVGLLFSALWQLRKKQSSLRITADDLHYQEHSPEELTAHQLLDLNSASLDDFSRLGLDGTISSQIVENRPYRNKLDLLSRMVIPEEVYNNIKHRVGIAGATETVKVGG